MSAPTEPVYLDAGATTPVDPRVRAAMLPFLEDEWGNPSSRHRAGTRVGAAIERARATLARIVDVPNERVVFTGGGTEANNLGVLGGARARAAHGRHVLVGPTEHSCVRKAAEALGRFEAARPDFQASAAKLAQAIVHGPDLLILDEPLSGTDPVGRHELMELVRELGDEGTSVLVSGREIDLANVAKPARANAPTAAKMARAGPRSSAKASPSTP